MFQMFVHCNRSQICSVTRRQELPGKLSSRAERVQYVLMTAAADTKPLEGAW